MTRNVVDVNHHVSQYVAIISNLRNEISDLKSQIKEKPREQALSSRARSVGQGMGADSDEKRNADKLRRAIAANFAERTEVRKQLVELNELNLTNKIQSNKRLLELNKWEKKRARKLPDADGAAAESPAPAWVESAQADVQTAKENVHKNNRLKREVEGREVSLVAEGERLHNEMARVVQNEERRLLLRSEWHALLAQTNPIFKRISPLNFARETLIPGSETLKHPVTLVRGRERERVPRTHRGVSAKLRCPTVTAGEGGHLTKDETLTRRFYPGICTTSPWRTWRSRRGPSPSLACSPTTSCASARWRLS